MLAVRGFGLHQPLAAIREHAQVRPLAALRFDQVRDARALQYGFVRGRCAMRGFHFDGAGQSVSIGGDGVHALLQIIMKQMRAELQIQAVSGQPDHGEKQNHRNDGDENVSDNQAIAQRPHEAPTQPRNQPDEQVHRRKECQEAEKSEERNGGAEKENDARQHIEDHDRHSDQVQQRGAPQEDEQPARGESVHESCFQALEE